jgi:bifunctional non-homologous end joining protein LigD
MRESAEPAAILAPNARRADVRVDGRTLSLSNLEKVLYPRAGFTKRELIEYYIRISPVLLPHLKGRALTLKRYPEGVEGDFFYEKRCPPYRPAWLHTAAIFSERKGDTVDYCVADDLASLVWAANLADLELHTSLALGRAPDRPTMMVFDLDPGEGSTIRHCARVALWVREKLGRLRLKSWPKGSGSKGLQLYVPLNTPTDFDQTREASRAIADHVAADHPEAVVTNMRKALRSGKVLIDWSQNNRHKTTVCVYSLRATPEPSVSAPLRWEEVEVLAASRRKASGRFPVADVLRRVEEHGDLFAPVLTLKQKLPH